MDDGTMVSDKESLTAEREMSDAEIHAMVFQRQSPVIEILEDKPVNHAENIDKSGADRVEVSQAEMRAILWGRSRVFVESADDKIRKTNMATSDSELGNTKACRPTSLSDEWNELCRLRESESANAINTLSKNVKLHTKRSIWKNFISLCAGLMFAFMTFLPLRNIQSSLYEDDSLGCISLSCIYSSFLLGSILSPWIVQNARPKGIILFSMFSHVLYVAGNLFPSFYSLLPVSCIFGFLQAPLWSVQELLIASYGSSYSVITGMKLEKSIPQLQSVFVIFCHSAQILGNLIESVVLTAAKDNNLEQYVLSNSSNNSRPVIYNASLALVHSGFEIHFGDQIVPKTSLTKLNDHVDFLKFIYLGLAGLSVTTIGFCLRKPDIILNKRKTPLKNKLRDVWVFFRSKTFLLLGLLMIFTGMQQGVVITDVTKIYGTDTLGLAMVGYLMMSYGTCQLATLLVLEKLQKRFKPIVFVLKGFLVTLGLLILLYVWEPRNNSIYTIFGFMALWGSVDAVWQSQVQNILLTSSIRKEPAVIGFRICQAVGLTVVFLMSIWLSLLYKVCAVGAVLVFGVMGYMMMEVTNNPVTPADSVPYSL